MGYDKNQIINAKLAEYGAHAGQKNALDDDLAKKFWDSVGSDDYNNILNVNKLAGAADSSLKSLTALQDQRKKGQASIDPIKRRLEAIQAPAMLQMENTAGEAPKMGSGPLPMYELQRQRLASEASKQGSAGSQAINRRFAALGALNSGTAIKQQRLAEEAVNNQKNEAANSINANEAQAQQEQHKQELARYDSNRNAALQRNFQRELTNQTSGFQAQLAGFDAASKLAGLDLQWAAHNAGREDSADSMALYREQMANQSSGFGDFLGSLVGTGIGAFTGGLGGGAAKKLLG